MNRRWVALPLLILILIVLYFSSVKGGTRVQSSPWYLHRAGDHQPLVMAHQGGEGEAPSNTMFAFHNSVREGADVLDTDMHITKDGVLVLIHDRTVNRTTNGKGAIADLSLAQIKQLDAAYRFTLDDGKTYPLRNHGITVPTLEEFFHEFPDKRLGIEIKDDAPEAAHRFCSFIRKYKLQDNILVSSFGQKNMDVFRKDCPEVASSATTNEVRNFLTLNLFHLTRLLSPRYSSFQVPVSLASRQIITPDFLLSANRLGIRVLPWTINEEMDMRSVIAMHVYGINTDYPGRLLVVLNNNTKPQRRQGS